MTMHRVRWVMLSAVFLIGCDSLNKLFQEDKPDAGLMTSDAGLMTSDAGQVTSDAGQTATGRDSAPAVPIPVGSKPSLAVEAPAMKATLSSLRSALTARNIDAATAQFTSDVRTRYRTMFESATTDKLDQLATALALVEVTTVIGGSVDSAVIRGEAVVLLNGRTFHLSLVKIDNQWLLETL